ncbi:ceramidase-domain-containing protein [Blastocladiella britannica]|nr:ceramidase-domain-containing protein [Blastocladiella britannica]
MSHIPLTNTESTIVGYWSPVTASVDWCETNYAVTPYIAEFFNATSNIFPILAGIALFLRARSLGLAARFQLAPLFLVLVGLGSAGFHGTLLYGPQLGDELPMIYMGLVLCYISLRLRSADYPHRPWIPYAMAVFAVIYSALHIHYRLVGAFHVICALILIPVAGLVIPIAKNDQKLQRMMWTASVLLVGSSILWGLDQAYCPTIENLYLHALWHVGTALAFVQWLEAMMLVQLRMTHAHVDLDAVAHLLTIVRVDNVSEKAQLHSVPPPQPSMAFGYGTVTPGRQ